MTLSRILALISLMMAGAILFAASPGLATGPAPDKAQEQAAKVPSTGNPQMDELSRRSRMFADTLKGEELKHLYHIREAFGASQAVKTVRRDIGNAVKACGKKNPDLKADMDTTYSVWTGAVDPVVKTKEQEIAEAVGKQTYLRDKEIKDYLKLLERAASSADNAIDKQVVTTPEACKGLLDSMEGTREKVVSLLGDMKLVPWPPVVEADKPKTTTPN